MAQLSNKALLNFSAATSALVLTESLRLIRNYRYYNNLDDGTISRDRIVDLVRDAKTLGFSLQNLMSKAEPDEAPFYVSIAAAIYDRLENIHRNLLFFDAGDIVDIIPLVDRQRAFWQHFNDVHFYEADLIYELEHSVPETLQKIEKKVIGLPQIVCV